jgi:EAL domain-containing protein (putative c-di-GMP-specific phosphodiesterase class I)
VEDGDGWHLLRLLGCDHAQGYFLSPPLEAPALLTWMREHDRPDGRREMYGFSAA